VVPQTVCIKVSDSIDGWLREAYFGKLLDGHPRAIRLYDVFPLMRQDGKVLYYLTLEYASHGDLAAFLERDEKPWTEAGGRSRASFRCWASCIAASCFIAISRR
jgi:serine/threonine protein kinase